MCCWRMQELQDWVVRAAEMGSAEELMRVGKEIVDFHGEMVLLVNYSALNYTGEFSFRSIFFLLDCVSKEQATAYIRLYF